MAEGEGPAPGSESNEQGESQGSGQGAGDKRTPSNGEHEGPEAAAEAAAELARTKSALAAQRKETERFQKELSDLRKANMTEQEQAVAEARTAGEAEATRKLSARLLQAEVARQAAGKLADPDDAVRLLDLGALMGNDGDFDPKAVARAVDELVKAKPYLAPPPPSANGRPPQGARDTGGAKADADDFIRGLVRPTR